MRSHTSNPARDHPDSAACRIPAATSPSGDPAHGLVAPSGVVRRLRMQPKGRYLAGALVTLGTVALFQADAAVAGAKTTGSTSASSRGAVVKPAATTKPTAKTSPKAATTVTYTVKVGDTLWDLAARNKLSVNALMSVNKITNADRIYAGEQLVIPGTAQSAPSPVTPKPTANNVKAAADVFTGPAPKPSPGGPLPAELAASSQRQKLRPTFRAAAAKYNVPVDLLEAMAWNESGWSNKMRSHTGAMGVGQLMPDTVTFVNESLIGKPLDPGVPEQNIHMSAAFLRYLLNENKGDTRLALASYYQGLASVRKIGPLPDTKVYVKTVIAIQRAYF